jgi:hypothetical protein
VTSSERVDWVLGSWGSTGRPEKLGVEVQHGRKPVEGIDGVDAMSPSPTTRIVPMAGSIPTDDSSATLSTTTGSKLVSHP